MLNYKIFADLVATKDDLWNLIQAIHRDWHIHEDRLISKNLEKSFDLKKEALDYPLPRALKEWHRSPSNLFLAMPVHCEPRAGQFRTYVFNHIVNPRTTTNQNEWITMLMDFQGCCEWAFSTRDAHKDDPPVYLGAQFNKHGVACDAPSLGRSAYGDARWQRVSDSISGFALQMLLIRMISGLCLSKRRMPCLFRGIYRGDFVLDVEALFKIRQSFPRLGLPDWETGGFWFRNCQLMGCEDGLILINNMRLSFISHTTKSHGRLASHFRSLGAVELNEPG